jgi:hypothetical protein
MKKICVWPLFFCLFTVVTCSFENNADYAAMEARSSREFVSPLDSMETDFSPPEALACCYESSNPPSALIDGNTATYWQSENGSSSLSYHFVTFDLGENKKNVYSLEYLPRHDNADSQPSTHIAKYEVWAGSNPIGDEPEDGDAVKVAEGEWDYAGYPGEQWFSAVLRANGGPVNCRYVQLRSLEDGTGSSDGFAAGGREVRFQIHGDFFGFDTTPLREAYFRGVTMLPFLKPTNNKFKLEKLLYGELDKDGVITAEGVKQYLETSIPLNLSISQQITWQKKYDGKTQEVYDLIFAISMEQEVR